MYTRRGGGGLTSYDIHFVEFCCSGSLEEETFRLHIICRDLSLYIYTYIAYTHADIEAYKPGGVGGNYSFTYVSVSISLYIYMQLIHMQI